MCVCKRSRNQKKQRNQNLWGWRRSVMLSPSVRMKSRLVPSWWILVLNWTRWNQNQQEPSWSLRTLQNLRIWISQEAVKNTPPARSVGVAAPAAAWAFICASTPKRSPSPAPPVGSAAVWVMWPATWGPTQVRNHFLARPAGKSSTTREIWSTTRRVMPTSRPHASPAERASNPRPPWVTTWEPTKMRSPSVAPLVGGASASRVTWLVTRRHTCLRNLPDVFVGNHLVLHMRTHTGEQVWTSAASYRYPVRLTWQQLKMLQETLSSRTRWIPKVHRETQIWGLSSYWWTQTELDRRFLSTGFNGNRPLEWF